MRRFSEFQVWGIREPCEVFNFPEFQVWGIIELFRHCSWYAPGLMTLMTRYGPSYRATFWLRGFGFPQDEVSHLDALLLTRVL